VTAGGITSLNTIAITGDPSTARAVWRIGDWTGSPKGFKNADLMTYAYPSDPRAASWTGNFIVGTATSMLTYAVPASAFPTDPSRWNVLKLSVASGSTGDTYLSPGVAFDCIDLLA